MMELVWHLKVVVALLDGLEMIAAQVANKYRLVTSPEYLGGF